jgi:hypothetical protein
MPCVYNQAVRVAIGVDVGVVRAEEAGIEGIVVVEGPRGSDMMVSCVLIFLGNCIQIKD